MLCIYSSLLRVCVNVYHVYCNIAIPLLCSALNPCLLLRYKHMFFTVCTKYSQMLDTQSPPHIILDTTTTGLASETVKSFTAALGLPTISASFGQAGDLRQWRNLDENEMEYLIQIMPPADVIPEIVRTIVLHQNITNAAILFDDSFGMQL